MRKTFRIAVILALLVPLLSAGEKFSVCVSTGLGAISPSDLNGFLEGLVPAARSVGWSVPGNGLKTFDLSDEFDISVWIPLSGRFSLFISGGLIGSSRSGNDFDFDTGWGSGTYKRSDFVRSVVFRLGASYAVPLSARLTLRPHLSADAHWTSFQDDGSVIFGGYGWEPQTEQEWTCNANAFRLGWTAGLGLDVALISRLALAIDAGYRRAKPTGFTGTLENDEYGFPEPPQNFRLLYSEQYFDWVNATYRLLNVPGIVASGAVRAVRDAVIDLSGLYFTAGLRLGF